MTYTFLTAEHGHIHLNTQTHVRMPVCTQTHAHKCTQSRTQAHYLDAICLKTITQCFAVSPHPDNEKYGVKLVCGIEMSALFAITTIAEEILEIAFWKEDQFPFEIDCVVILVVPMFRPTLGSGGLRKQIGINQTQRKQMDIKQTQETVSDPASPSGNRPSTASTASKLSSHDYTYTHTHRSEFFPPNGEVSECLVCVVVVAIIVAVMLLALYCCC